jgi:WXXGXW repeat (2 copies)
MITKSEARWKRQEADGDDERRVVAGSAGGGMMQIVKWVCGLVLLSACVGLVNLAGCVVNEPEAPSRSVVVSGPPPAPVREDRPPAPAQPSVWVNGYWHWTGMQYAWIPGHWDAPPPGSAWNGPVYTMRDGRYFYQSGSWQPSQPANAIR